MDNFNEDKAVARLAEIVALECGLHPTVTERLRAAAALHDIGKQRIPESILDKPGKLDEREFKVMKTHTVLGAEMLLSIQDELGGMARTICLYHHEWYDGSAYLGRRTDELPAYVSIVSICDVLVALLSERPYKHTWPPSEALGYIQNQAGTQFSPSLVKIFISLVRNDSRVLAIIRECDT